jgi:sporulation protein YlmC with PRC-barrel domain
MQMIPDGQRHQCREADRKETMLRSLKDIHGYKVNATDGDIGTVANFLFDDKDWAIRYLVVETGDIFDDRRVLISPISFGEPVWSDRQFPLALTVDRVKNSPGIDTDKPVSRQQELALHGYYGYPCYWGSSGIWYAGDYPNMLANASFNEPAIAASDSAFNDVHLRSAAELHGYHIKGSDGAIGHVEDLIIDDETWAVRYLVIDTSNWWFGKKVLVSPLWAEKISWAERNVYIDMSRQSIKESPQLTSAEQIDRDYETNLYNYYGRPIYWSLGQLPVEEESPHHMGADTK